MLYEKISGQEEEFVDEISEKIYEESRLFKIIYMKQILITSLLEKP